MIRNLKALGLALVAVFAIGAMMASTASATDFFTNAAGKNSDLLTGVSHDHKFNITPNSDFTCTTSRFAGTSTHGSSEVTVDPEYFGTPNTAHTATEHCVGPANHKVVVDMNGCDYDLTGNTVVTEDGTRAKVSITCPVGNKIVVTDTTVGIAITVPPQTPTDGKGGVTYTNLPNHTGGAAIEVNVQVTGITWECSGSAFLCNLGVGGTHGNNADYTGTLIATCWADTEGLPTPVTEGARTGCSIS